MKARFAFALALGVSTLPLKASAQAWVSNPNYSEGIGIRAGNLELHPSLGGEFGYDSNFFRSSEREGTVDVLRLRITPSLSLATLGKARRNSPTPPSVTFIASAYAAYNEVFALDSENSDVSAQRNVAIGADARLDIYPQRKFGFDLGAGYVRAIEPDGDPDGLRDPGFVRDTVRADAGVTWRPGGGTFEWRAGYGLVFNFFEEDDFQVLNNVHHEINTRGRWRFLPRSALLYDASYTFVRYNDSATQQTDGDAVRARVGFHGLVTYHLALLGMLGWASSFYEAGVNTIAPQQFDSLLANAEVRWFLMPAPSLETANIATGLSSIALGYARSFSNSYYGSFYQRDRGYLQFSMFLLGSIVGGIEFGVSRVAYPDVVIGGFEQASFDQVRIDGRLFTEYRFTDTLATNATLQYDKVSSEPVNNEDLDYDRWQAFVGLRWFM